MSPHPPDPCTRGTPPAAPARRPAGASGRRPALLGTLALAALCSGCAGLLPKPPAAPARYTLDLDAGRAGPAAPVAPAAPAAPATATAAATADAPTLVVAVPVAGACCDSTRMLWLRQAQAPQAYAQHQWADTPARLLAPLLVRALQDSGAFRAVLAAPSAGSGTLRLETELLRLHQDFSTRPSRVRLTLRAVLIDTPTRRPLAWAEFDAFEDTASEDAPGGVAAAGVAVQGVMARLARFVVTAAAASAAPAPGPAQVGAAGGAGGAVAAGGTRREP